jgi:outer membrane receptor protein involved in Fe transport
MCDRCSIVVLACLVLATPALAQETTTGSLGGQIVDAQGLALPGVTVTVTSSAAPRTAVTDDQGRFLIAFLTPGVYGVRAELTGFSPVERPQVEVRLGQRAELNLTLTVGALSETVQVSGNTGVIDVTNTTVGANIDSATLARIPVQRQLGDTLYLAPGVSSGGGTGRQNPSVGGASGLDNQFFVDGVNITNPGYGALGSYSIVLGSLGTGVTFDFIQEVQVKTAGYEAQYGAATGGVVSVVTKTGSNTVRGTAFAYSQPHFAQSAFTPIESTAATRPEVVNTVETEVSDAGAEISGPILHDKLFFFGALDPQRDRATYIAPVGFPLHDAGPSTRERKVVAYSAKATWQPTGGHRLDASFFGDPGQGPVGPQRRTALLRTDTSGFSSLDSFGGHNQTVRYNGSPSSKWLLEASVARATNGVVEVPSQTTCAYTDIRTEPHIRRGGIGFFENTSGRTLQFQAFSTHLLGAAGQHQIRYGVQYEDVDYDNITNYSGPTFLLSNGQETVTGASVDIRPDPALGQFYRVTRANLSNVRTTRQSYTSVFLQDVWQVGSRLTIRPGVRLDTQTLEGNLADHSFGNNWAPRIGVTWDPTGRGGMKVFGNYGHFYARIPNDLAARALSADAGVTRADYYDAALTQPIPEGTSAGGSTRHLIFAGLSPSTFDDSAGSTYSREGLVGFEWEAAPGLALSLRYTMRRYGRVLEDVGTLPMVAYVLPDVPGAESVEYFITNPGPDTPVTGDLGVPVAFEKPVHDYDAFEVEANKRFSRNWALQASYRYSRTRGNFEGFFRNDNGQSDPGITSLFDFPTNDPTYATIGAQEFGFRGDIRFLGTAGNGPLPNDRTHQGKIFGNYVFGFGLNLGLGLNLSSGRPLTALAANPVYDSTGEIPETPRGAGFQTQDGFRERTPFESSVDVHADYALRMPRSRLVLLADMFNLFDQQRVRDYDDFTESAFGVTNPDFGRILAYQTPFTLRVGARLEF